MLHWTTYSAFLASTFGTPFDLQMDFAARLAFRIYCSANGLMSETYESSFATITFEAGRGSRAVVCLRHS